jgi:hypothetical protein
MSKKIQLNLPLILAALIFALSLIVGYSLSLRRPLWNDEIYTQVAVVDQMSYPDMLYLRRGLEGNSCPLFYLIQKSVSDAMGYQFPFHWESEWMLMEEGSQVIMRLGPNFFMSLSIALIFYFFARFYALAAGIYAFLLTLASCMVWAYWVEARPYALWFFLTTCQSLLFLSFIRDKGRNPSRLTWITVVHILLSLTLILSIMQIVIVSFLLWMYGERSWRKHLLATIVPLGICFLYYHRSIAWRYAMPDYAFLIFHNVPPERILLLLVYCVCLVFYSWARRKTPRQAVNESGTLSGEGAWYGILFLYFFLVALVFLGVMTMRAAPGESALPDRYLLFLTPAGIIATTVVSVDIIKYFRSDRWMLVNAVVIFGGLLVFRFSRTFIEIFGF